jgi:hypothetical protein
MMQHLSLQNFRFSVLSSLTPHPKYMAGLS